jgi:hypothetical protein
MKKILLFSAIMIALGASAQKLQKPNFSIGLATAVPTDANSEKVHVNLGSTWFQVTTKYNNKFTGVIDFGYVKFKGDSETNFAVIPFMVGLKYAVNESVYFGSSAGVGFYNKKDNGTNSFMFAPFIGVKMNHVSVDARYISIVEKTAPVKTIALVVSYTL